MILVPSTQLEDWQKGLAGGDRQWKRGFSAMSLAESWHGRKDFPPRFAEVLRTSYSTDLVELKPLIGVPEREVKLPGGSKGSRTDLWLLCRGQNGLVSVAVEGKAAEPFGDPVGVWRSNPTLGKVKRIAFLCRLLELPDAPPLDALRYQLLHRTAAAIIEAHAFRAPAAAMIVHAFSEPGASPCQSFDDYASFLRALGVASPRVGAVHEVGKRDGVRLHCGWVDDRFP